MLVQDFLRRSAGRYPDKTALVCGPRRLTYSEIDAAANRLANALRARGVRRGDRVVLFLNNSVEAVVALFAVLKAGAVFVFVSRSTSLQTLTFVLNDCRPTALVTDAYTTGAAIALVGRVRSIRAAVIVSDNEPRGRATVLGFDAVQRMHGADEPPTVNTDNDLACLIYTSGSTGNPKGVMCGHDNVVFASTSVTTYLEHAADDVILNALPVSFSYGLYQVLMAFQIGARLVLERSFAFPSSVLAQIPAERVTGLAGVPTMFATLLRMDLSAYDVSSLRYLTNAAAALPVPVVRDLRLRIPHARLFLMYGLTEVKRALYLTPDEVDRRPASVGKAIPGTEAWIQDEHGRRLGPGYVGELVVRGRHVMRGYWDDPVSTAIRFAGDAASSQRTCRTGDLFSLDDDGYFYFHSRKDDVIKIHGRKIAPGQIEDVLCGAPGVVEAAVIGRPDPVVGERLQAFVVVDRSDVDEASVLQYCRGRLDDHLVPRSIEFRSELPRTASGKIRKRDLAPAPAFD